MPANGATMTGEEWNNLLDTLPKLGIAKDSWDRGRPTGPETEWQNLYLQWRQKIFRIAAGGRKG